MKDGEFLRRWEEFKKRWKFWIPVISVDKFLRDTIDEMKDEYPKWTECVEDIAQGEEAIPRMIEHFKRLWTWILRWF